MGLYFLAWLVAVGWLFYWVIMCHRDPAKFEKKWPFAMRDHEELQKKYGKRLPY